MNILVSAALVCLSIHLSFAIESTKCKGYSVIIKTPIGHGQANHIRINDNLKVTLYPNCTASIQSSFTIDKGFVNATVRYDIIKVVVTPMTVYAEKDLELSYILTQAGYDIAYPITSPGAFVGDSTKLIDFSKNADYLPLAVGDATVKAYVYFDGLSKLLDTFTFNVAIKKV